VGPLQTYFYLGLVSFILVGLGVLFVFVAFRSLRRWLRIEQRTPLIFWLVGGAVTLSLLVLVVGTIGVFYGFFVYGGA
jgi:hypothetical protein